MNGANAASLADSLEKLVPDDLRKLVLIENHLSD